MSDPVTNVEIEDVLSSIRRLVAEGDKVKQEKKREYGEVTPPAERLVLTPALRISEADSSAVKEKSSLHDQVDPAGFAFVPASDEVADDQLVVEGDAQDAPQIESVAIAEDEDSAPAPLVLTNHEHENTRESLEATIAALEAAVEGEVDEFEPDGSEVKTAPSWESAGFTGFNSRRDLSDEGDVDPVEPETSEPEPAEVVQEAPEAPEVLTPESRIFRVIPENAPDELEEVASDTAAVKPSAVTTSAHRKEDDYGDEMIGEQSRALAVDDDIEAALTEDMFMDEEMLRSIVSEVLKGELEGKLGDTITRNVRKLVRKEIHRVLTHQELE